MAGNANLGAAKAAKNDEFYTQWNDIENEMRAYLEYDPDVFRDKVILLPCDDPGVSNFTKYFTLNFENFGLKKLISTSYAPASNPTVAKHGQALLNFELGEDQDEKFNEEDTWNRGRIYVLERGVDLNEDGVLNKDDLKWDYLEGDGDFRSEEVTALRDEADMVITNPPFSLFREFMAWLQEGGVEFSIIGNMNAFTYKEIFPLIKDNHTWVGANGIKPMTYRVPDVGDVLDSQYYADGVRYQKMGNTCWFTNIQHGRRREPLQLMSIEDNLIYGSKRVRETSYPKYDNYDAIEVPENKGIPSDYAGVMGVPISFLGVYCPEQFEIVGISGDLANPLYVDGKKKSGRFYVSGKRLYDRIAIRHRNPETKKES